MMENKELKHVGVLGMKWGRRRGRAADAADRDAASLRKAGYHKEAAALTENARRLRAKQTEIDNKKANKKAVLEAKLQLRAKNARELSESLAKEAVAAGAKRGKKVDYVKEKTYWDNLFKEDINNITVDSYRKEQRKHTATAVASTLTIIGLVALKAYADKKVRSVTGG